MRDDDDDDERGDTDGDVAVDVDVDDPFIVVVVDDDVLELTIDGDAGGARCVFGDVDSTTAFDATRDVDDDAVVVVVVGVES